MRKSQIFLYFSLCFIFGIFLRSFFSLSLFLAYLVLLLGLVIAILNWPHKKIRIIFLGTIFLFLGILRFDLSIPQEDENKIWFYNGKEITFKGRVTDEPDVRISETKLTIESEEITTDSNKKKIKDKILVNTPLYPNYYYGDELEITCKIEEPGKIEDFDYQAYLRVKGIYSVCFKPQEIKLLSSGGGSKFRLSIFKVKNKFKNIINLSLPEPPSSLLSALVLGLRKEIPQDLLDNFNKTGTSHIIAISGLHITILSGIIAFLLMNLGLSKRKTFLPSVLILFLFILLIGFKPSAIRAGMMGFLLLFALREGRMNRILNSLFFTACILLFLNPLLLRFDLSFQLSFLAVLGIIFLNPYFIKWLKKIPNTFQMRNILSMTLSAQSFSLPMIIFSFGRLPLIAPLSNIFILPLLPLIMASGFILGLIGFIFLPLAQVLGWGLWVLLSFIILIVNFLVQIPYAFLDLGQVPFWLIAILYLITILVLWKGKYFIRQLAGYVSTYSRPIKKADSQVEITEIDLDEIST